MSVTSSYATEWWDCVGLWQQRGTHWKAAGISPVQWYQTVNWAFIQNCRWDLWYSWSEEHRGEQNHVQSLRAEGCRGYFLSPSSQIGCGLFTLLLASPFFCLSSAVSPSPCAYPTSLSMLPCIIHCFLIATASSSSTWFPCSLFFCIPVCLLLSFPPWCSGANRGCIETGRRNWLPSLFPWKEQGCTGIVFLELLLAAEAILLDVLKHWSWVSGCVAKRGPEKLACVQWRLNLKRPELLYFTVMTYMCNNIPFFTSLVPSPNLNGFPPV